MSDYQKVLEQEISDLKQRVAESQLPDEMRRKVEKDIVALERSVELGSYDEKYEKVSKYVDWVLRVPWEKTTQDVLDIQQAKKVFDDHHYGMDEVKERFMEYVSVLKLRHDQFSENEFRAPIVLLVGLVGTGKTTFAFSLAKALKREIVRIPFGGMGSAKDLRGESRLILGAEPGAVIRGICQAQTRNPVILLDEIDRVSKDSNADIMGVLIELLDPAQNDKFTDSYIDYPVDLSQAIFIATANNTGAISTAVLDRMEKISMPSYTDEEKIKIGKDYLLPQLMEEAGLTEKQLVIEDDVWPQMVRPLGFDAGIRTLQRNIQGAVRKAARILVERGYNEVIITRDNAKIFLPQY